MDLSAIKPTHGIFDTLLMIPLGTSAVTLGLGYIIFFNKPPFLWGASQWLIPMAHTLVALPFVVRGLIPAVGSIPRVLPAKCSHIRSFSLESDPVNRSADYQKRFDLQPCFLLYDFSGRIWSNIVFIKARLSNHPHSNLPVSIAAGRIELWSGNGHEYHPDAGMCIRHCFH